MKMYHAKLAALGLVRGEQVFPPRTKKPGPVARFTLPEKTRCAIKKLSDDEWRPYRLRRSLGFERFERLVWHEGATWYEFREGAWLILVASRLIVRRNKTRL